MQRSWPLVLAAAIICLTWTGDADGRGFGSGFRGGAGGFSGGGYRGGSFGGFSGYRGGGFEGGSREGGFGQSSFGGYRSEGFGGFSGANRSADYSGSRSGGYYSGARAGAGGGSYDRSWTGSRGGSIDTSGERGYAYGPRGGAAAGGTRDTTVTGPGGRSYSGSDTRGAAVGPYGRMVGGGSRSATASSSTAFAGSHTSTDFGLAHYSSFSAAGVGHSTAYWSHSEMSTRAGYVRGGFGYYNTFRPGWYTSHPGAWYAAGWSAGAAWTAASWPSLASWCSIPAAPVYYDYGNTVVYQDNNVYVNGQDAGTAQQYAQQATTLATQGQQATASPEQEWQALGVFALVQGQEKTSNNVFQLAVSKAGILRGNYYDGLMDETVPIYGSVDKKTQRAAWTIGKKKDRVFETGLNNLTKDETPVLVHVGDDKTQQWLLVRMQQPKE